MIKFIARRLVKRVSAKSTADCQRKAPGDFEPDLDFARSRLTSTSTQVLICGHTHRPREEDLGEGRRLIVLPPWCETQAGYQYDGTALARFHVTPAGEIATVGTE